MNNADERQMFDQRPVINLGERERLASALAGSLLIYATARRHRINTLLLLGGGYLLYRAVTGHCALSAISARRSRAAGDDMKVRAQLVVNKPRAEVYAFWRRLENLPMFMTHLEHVDEFDDRTSAWRLKLPGGAGDVRWEAKIVKDEKDTEISWHSVEGAAVRNTGKINFADTPGKGTRIDAMISYGIPRGPIGDRLAALLTPSFRQRIEEDIQRCKKYLESEMHAH
ncbi:MAG TPA: SRPBCC family protein [Puia sp.]|nr:SRPBCC family protein [Puia sp.]